MWKQPSVPQGLLAKQTVAHLCHGMLFRNRKTNKLDTYSDFGRSHDFTTYAKRKIYHWLLLYNSISRALLLFSRKVTPDFLQPHGLPPGSSLQEISQARMLERVAISFSRSSSRPRDWTLVSWIGRWILYHWATRKAHEYWSNPLPKLLRVLCD